MGASPQGTRQLRADDFSLAKYDQARRSSGVRVWRILLSGWNRYSHGRPPLTAFRRQPKVGSELPFACCSRVASQVPLDSDVCITGLQSQILRELYDCCSCMRRHSSCRQIIS